MAGAGVDRYRPGGLRAWTGPGGSIPPAPSLQAPCSGPSERSSGLVPLPNTPRQFCPELESGPDPLPTTVQDSETNVDPPEADPPQRPARSTPHANIRDRILQALYSTDDDLLRTQAEKIKDCGDCMSIRAKSDGGFYLCRDRCRARLCPECSHQRGRVAAERIEHVLKAADDVRHLTLTLRSQDAPLAAQLDILTASFRRLRQTATWRTHCRGAIGSIQITRNAKSGLWHPHLHILVDGVYWPHAEIMAAWAKASGGSDILLIKPVHSRSKHAAYIARYVTAPNEIAAWPTEAICEYARASRSRRTLITCGSMHGQGLPPKETDNEDVQSHHACYLHHLRRGVAAAWPDAIKAVRWLGVLLPNAIRVLPRLSEDDASPVDGDPPPAPKALADLLAYIDRRNGVPPPPPQARRIKPPWLPGLYDHDD